MPGRLNEILEEINELERKVQEEMRRREEELQYRISEGRVIFEREVLALHTRIKSSLLLYITRASLLTVLSAPVIYAMIVPALLLDLCVWIYQTVCFPIYGIAKVKRSDHIFLDRRYLQYLNLLERLNCDYCGYFNSLILL